MNINKIRHIQECNQSIEQRFITERLSDLRSYKDQVGWREKGSELSSGGNLTDEITDVVNDLIHSAATMGCKGTFTAGNDKFHQGKGGLHPKGQAIDLTLPQECHQKFIQLLNTFVTKYPGFSYIDEYKNPSAHATGGHFHISYNKGNPEKGKSFDFDTSSTTTSSTSDDTNDNSIVKDMLGSLLFPSGKI